MVVLWLPGPPSRGGRRHSGQLSACRGRGCSQRSAPACLAEYPGSHCQQGRASWARCGRHGLRGCLADTEARCFVCFGVLCPVECVTKIPGGLCLQFLSRSCGDGSRVPALPPAHGMGWGVQSHLRGSAGAEGLGGDPKGRKPPLSFRGGELGLCWWQEARQDGIFS